MLLSMAGNDANRGDCLIIRTTNEKMEKRDRPAKKILYAKQWEDVQYSTGLIKWNVKIRLTTIEVANIGEIDK